jgi:ferritin-like metal-binding protein YciE
VSAKTLKDAYLEGLQDIYDGEHQIVTALPKMAEAAGSAELKQAFEQHLEQTKNQIARLEQVFEMLGEEPERKPCKGIRGIIAEGKEHMEEAANKSVLDAMLVSAAQHVEHYEMATYGTLRTWAAELDLADQSRLLQQTLNEEGETDKLLTKLAESRINQQAETGKRKAA